MTKEEFERESGDRGFSEPVLVSREANGGLEVHDHPFEAFAYVLEGSIEIGLGSESAVYKAGETFHLKKLQPHWEKYGPNGVRYLSSRKQ